MISFGNDSPKFDSEIVTNLMNMLDLYNPLAKQFRSARDRFNSNDDANVQLKLIKRRDQDGQMHNLLCASKVAMIIVRDIGHGDVDRDVIVKKQFGIL